MNNKSKKYISVEEYVLINGIHQYLFHSGTNGENPVMLFLHGRPGRCPSQESVSQSWSRMSAVRSVPHTGNDPVNPAETGSQTLELDM